VEEGHLRVASYARVPENPAIDAHLGGRSFEPNLSCLLYNADTWQASLTLGLRAWDPKHYPVPFYSCQKALDLSLAMFQEPGARSQEIEIWRMVRINMKKNGRRRPSLGWM
jgi:hypothetical protein